MAGVFRVGVMRLVAHGPKSTAAATTKALLSVNVPAVSQSCNITGKSFRGKPLVRPKPWDYKNKTYNVFHSMYDKTTWRFDENSKIIVVEGPIAAGKSDFAKGLADELEMLFIPEPTMDRHYINSYGFDFRSLNDQLPPGARSVENKDFLTNPNNPLIANFQFQMMIHRFSDYIDALAHVLSTGQGVVLERSIYSDFIFMENMYKFGYLSKNCRSYYNQIMREIIPHLLRPHLVIYLDVPVAEVKNRIKKRNIDYEVNSKVLTDEYLKSMETTYKQIYLKDISSHAELLVYDWSNYGDPEVVVEDIERIDFDRFDKHSKKMADWRFDLEEEWNEKRIWFAGEKAQFLQYVNVPRLDVPELILSAEDTTALFDLYNNSPGNKYRQGYNADMGDENLLWKTKLSDKAVGQ